jgi:hypothetical protein
MSFPFPVGGGDEELGLLDALLGGEGLEEFTSPLENGLECGAEQRLAKPSGTAQKIRFSLGDHLVDEGCLVYIDVSTCADALEALYAYGVFSQRGHGDNVFVWAAKLARITDNTK